MVCHVSTRHELGNNVNRRAPIKQIWRPQQALLGWSPRKMNKFDHTVGVSRLGFLSQIEIENPKAKDTVSTVIYVVINYSCFAELESWSQWRSCCGGEGGRGKYLSTTEVISSLLLDRPLGSCSDKGSPPCLSCRLWKKEMPKAPLRKLRSNSKCLLRLQNPCMKCQSPSVMVHLSTTPTKGFSPDESDSAGLSSVYRALHLSF